MSPTTLLADPALRVVRPRLCVTAFVAPAKAARPRPALRARWFVLTALVALASAAIVYLGTWPPLATVMSASMAPTINTGDMVVLQRLDRPVRIGDIVVVRVPDEARARYGYPPVVIHRAYKIDQDGMLTTKGDGRKETDPFTVPATAPKDRVVATIPAAGQVLGFLTSGLGLVWIGVGGLMFGVLPFLDRHRAARRREQADHARTLEEAMRDAAEAREQLRLVSTALADHLEALPAKIESAVVAAVASVPPPPPPPPAPARAVAFVAASTWSPPPTPDLMGVLTRPAGRFERPAPRWDAPPDVWRAPAGALCA